ncbi:glutaminase kidney isoform, mitochondrial-like [Chironomus tepperi]|uniref:glutaminase kidney isoform, mitochondrial-like n=1 Tax=Chironomus tepperi TaxID=113505 RepID=UPI00391F3E17
MSDEKALYNVYRSYLTTGSLQKFMNDVKTQGIQEDDPRMQRLTIIEKEAEDEKLDFDTFAKCMNPLSSLLKKVTECQFIIPDFQSFTKTIEEIYWMCKGNTSGENSTYIPQLSEVPDYFGVSMCTIDGQRYSIGDTKVPFSIQSCSKPLSYAIALEYLTSEVVHQYVGQEPSGRMFNEMVLDHNNKPHNPMINAGAIVIASLLYTLIERDSESMDKKLNLIKSWMERAAGNEYFNVDESSFLAEREIADRNFALGYFMREKKVFPEKANLLECLDFFFQLNSIQTTAEAFSVVASTLANGGVCPLTNEKIFSTETCRDVLSLMHSCGLYDYSGKFAFNVGLPAKSGVSGVVMLTIPNLAGICCYSPQLDEHGNSVRGIQFCEELLKVYAMHPYDNLRHSITRKSVNRGSDWFL